LRGKREISSSAVAVAVAVILIAAVAGVYLATRGGGAPSTTTTTTTTLDPRNSTDNSSERVNRIIYEGLVEFGQNLNIKPMLGGFRGEPMPTYFFWKKAPSRSEQLFPREA